MKAFITGVSGFVGAALARELLRRGHSVHGLVRGTTQWRLTDIQDRITLHTGDLIDKESVGRAMSAAQPSVVFHLGAYGTYPGKQSDVQQILETTIFGSLNVFTTAKEYGVPQIISVGSSSEYGTKNHPMCEDELLEPNSYYGVGKAAQTLLGAHMARSDGVSITTVRLFSVFGPFEEPGRFVPTVIRNALLGEDIAIADPSIARDYCYVSDAIEALILAGEKTNLSGEIINVSNGKQHTLMDVYDAVIAATGSNSKAVVGAHEKRTFDTKTWVADVEKMRTLLGFTPRFSLAEGIMDMVKWFPEHAHVYDH